MRTVAVGLLLICGLFAASCGDGESDERGSDVAKKKDGGEADSLQAGVPVSIVKASLGDIVASVAFSATVESERMVKVYPQTSGLVQSVVVEEGDRVRAGQVLVQLDDDDAEIALRRSQAELRKQQADSLRTARLFNQGLVSRNEYEQALYEVSRAHLDLEDALLTLRRTRIRAPVDGVIATRNVEIGDRVGGSSPVYDMVTLDRLVAQVHIPGRTRPNLRVGQLANITSDMLPGHEIQGVIQRISPVINPQSGTVKVTVELRDPKRLFAPGMFASVALITDQKSDALLAPKEALVYDAGQAYAFVVKADTARRVRLELGLTNARQVQVISGMVQDDSIIVVGHEGLRGGALVRVIDDAKKPVPKLEPVAATDSVGVVEATDTDSTGVGETTSSDSTNTTAS